MGSNGTILRWNGSAWRLVTSPTTEALGGTKMVSAEHWLGDRGREQWGVTAVERKFVEYRDHPYYEYHDVESLMVSATNGWAVGYKGTILHWNGSAWSAVTSPTTNTLTSISMVSANDGWAVGLGATSTGGTFLRWNGSAWSIFDNPSTYPLYSVAMVSAADGWATTWSSATWSSVILRWNGSIWAGSGS